MGTMCPGPRQADCLQGRALRGRPAPPVHRTPRPHFGLFWGSLVRNFSFHFPDRFSVTYTVPSTTCEGSHEPTLASMKALRLWVKASVGSNASGLRLQEPHRPFVGSLVLPSASVRVRHSILAPKP